MPTEQRDRQLWEGLRQGKEQALSALFMAYAEELYRFGYLLCRDKELTEDCLQDLFQHLWRKQAALSAVSQVRNYLRVALRNRIKEALRQRYPVQELTDHAASEHGWTTLSAEERWLATEQQDLQHEFLHEALATLPERMRQAVVLRYLQGLDYAEIAEIMNIRRQVAVNMVYRATQKLRLYSAEHAKWLFIWLALSLFS